MEELRLLNPFRIAGHTITKELFLFRTSPSHLIVLLVAVAGLTSTPVFAEGDSARCELFDSPPGPLPPPPSDPAGPFIVFFDWNSATIRPTTAAILANVVTVYGGLPGCTIAITARADRSGPADYNLALSRRRANEVAAYLRRGGIRSHFRIEALGETRPYTPTPDGRPHAENRQVEIMIEVPPEQRD